jgi:hypothetical protein
MLGRDPRPLMCDDDMAVFLRRFRQGVKAFLHFDACHSGTMDRGINPHYRRSKFVNPPVDIMAREESATVDDVRVVGRKDEVNTYSGRSDVFITHQQHLLLSGCRDNQTSADADINGMPQGAMTAAFINAFKVDDSCIDIHSWMNQWLTDNGHGQVPQLTASTNMLVGGFYR